MLRTNIRKRNHGGKIFPNTFNSLTYPLHLFIILRPQQWLWKVNSALCKWRKALKGGSTLRVQVFLAWSFSMVFIPIEGRELTLVSERSLERQTKSLVNSFGHKAKAVPVSNLSMCYSGKIKIWRKNNYTNSLLPNCVHFSYSQVNWAMNYAIKCKFIYSLQIHIPVKIPEKWRIDEGKVLC